MKPFLSSWAFGLFLFSALFLFFPISSSSLLPPLIGSTSFDELRNYTAILSDFRTVNRRVLKECHDPNPYIRISVSKASRLADEEYLVVTVSGVLVPAETDWVAMVSPSDSK